MIFTYAAEMHILNKKHFLSNNRLHCRSAFLYSSRQFYLYVYFLSLVWKWGKTALFDPKKTLVIRRDSDWLRKRQWRQEGYILVTKCSFDLQCFVIHCSSLILCKLFFDPYTRSNSQCTFSIWDLWAGVTSPGVSCSTSSRMWPSLVKACGSVTGLRIL